MCRGKGCTWGLSGGSEDGGRVHGVNTWVGVVFAGYGELGDGEEVYL